MTATDQADPAAGTIFHSRLYGLNIASALDLYSRRHTTQDDRDLILSVGDPVPSTGDVPDGELQVQWSTADGLRASFVQQTDGTHLLRFEATCDVTIDAAASNVTLHMVEGKPEDMGGVLLGGTVLSYLLILREQPVLHASAVEVDGGAVAFVGSSGMGKTTLATLLCQAGGKLITDDVLRLEQLDAGGYGCHLGATELRLREAAAELAENFGDAGTHRTTADARRALSVPLATRELTPLIALIIPRPRRDLDELALTRLEPRDGAISLLSFPRIVGIQAPRLLTNQFLQMTEIAEEVPIFVADVPWGPPFAADLPQRLLDETEQAVARSKR